VLVTETISVCVETIGLACASGSTKARITPIRIATPISIRTMVNVLFDEVFSAMHVSERDGYADNRILRLYTLVVLDQCIRGFSTTYTLDVLWFVSYGHNSVKILSFGSLQPRLKNLRVSKTLRFWIYLGFR
jgi:hypothetical protein